MQSFHSAIIEASLKIPAKYPGPGGALAVISKGEVLVKSAWGFADIARDKNMRVDTLMPICSITKQFTCALLLDRLQDPEVLAGSLQRFLPKLKTQMPTIRQMANNQSGIRDYPTMSILCGLGAEDVFNNAHIQNILSHIQTTQSVPGTEYSYSNTNFHIIARLLEEHTGRDFGELLRDRLFNLTGMKSAQFIPDSSETDKYCVGYEGSFDQGFIPARNRSRWIGDAGIAASLDDLIAWEQFIQKTDRDEDSLYRRLSTPQWFSEGAAAPYGFGLSHNQIAGTTAVGHGGGMRGWRLHRSYARAAGLSVIVMFNHEADARQAAFDLLETGLSSDFAEKKLAPTSDLSGEYVDFERGCRMEVEANSLPPYVIEIEGERYPAIAETPGKLVSDACSLVARDGVFTLAYPDRRPASTLFRLGVPTDVIEGKFQCVELDAVLTLETRSNATYGSFQGAFGASDYSLVRPAGNDVWILANQRGIDVSPGPMTIIAERNSNGNISGLRISAPMARNIWFARQFKA